MVFCNLMSRKVYFLGMVLFGAQLTVAMHEDHSTEKPTTDAGVAMKEDSALETLLQQLQDLGDEQRTAFSAFFDSKDSRNARFAEFRTAMDEARSFSSQVVNAEEELWELLKEVLEIDNYEEIDNEQARKSFSMLLKEVVATTKTDDAPVPVLPRRSEMNARDDFCTFVKLLKSLQDSPDDLEHREHVVHELRILAKQITAAMATGSRFAILIKKNGSLHSKTDAINIARVKRERIRRSQRSVDDAGMAPLKPGSSAKDEKSSEAPMRPSSGRAQEDDMNQEG